eukprot:CAMPEP_0195305488 /NCGR_PEP_ID=MMETSP0707-20130614/36357_1 /TAXON_ID=33640 /ORGANISM="Asterionellopsis glacialis, Strain CCMP134" /LENGTH=488 /DNA_ID=CAMNT_0040369627 /DNA_START=51 /DNA_END=1517 /DNA_ORIENTATION=-
MVLSTTSGLDDVDLQPSSTSMSAGGASTASMDDFEMTEMKEMVGTPPDEPPTNQRRNRLLIAVGLVVVVVLVIIPVYLTTGSKSSEGPTSQAGIGEDPGEVVGDATEQANPAIYEEIFSMSERHGIDTTPLTLSNTPQYNAYQWLVTQNANLELYDHQTRIQRYVLATLFYSTNAVKTVYTLQEPPAWKNTNGWLTDADECTEWKGIFCTSRGQVYQISLENNGLTGALPPELAMLQQMEILDCTTNLLYMEGPQLEPLAKLSNLKTLLLDDNYITTNHGLPDFLTSLSHLEKLRLSYNLLDGTLDPQTLGALTKLTHLEVESNFLQGSIPPAFGQMTSLVYAYLRRNALTVNLEDFITTDSNLMSLFALWLDDNTLVGSIPTEIGLVTSLASLSLTDGNLEGSIPAEIGNLRRLRRLWLYNNQLTGTLPDELGALSLLEVLETHSNNINGTMPRPVCSIMEAATYQSKSLTADCNELECSECCTECF